MAGTLGWFFFSGVCHVIHSFLRRIKIPLIHGFGMPKVHWLMFSERKTAEEGAMKYLERTFDRFLEDWHGTPERKPLVVRGIRGVGKTESIRRFARRRYRGFIEINFAKCPAFRTILQDGASAQAVASRIAYLEPALKRTSGKTLLYFDDIQAFPDISASFESFRQDGRFDIIASGFLAGSPHKTITAFSADSTTDYTLRSLDFAEFLSAQGYGTDYTDHILSHMVERRPLSPSDRILLFTASREFGLVGGMPQVVRTFLERKSVKGLHDLQRQLVLSNVDALSKEREKTRIMQILARFTAQLASPNKKFQISKDAPDARLKTYRADMEWLQDAGLLMPCQALHFPQLPIQSQADDSRFKFYMADTGLLYSAFDEKNVAVLRGENGQPQTDWSRGLFENMVAEALFKAGAPLVYYNRTNSPLKVPFLLSNVTHLVPVDIQAFNGRSKALRTLVTDPRYPDISWGVKLGRGNIAFDGAVLTLPLATAFLLPRFLASGIDPRE